MLFRSSGFAPLFWIGQVALGGLLPLALIYHPATGSRDSGVLAAALLVILGGLVQLYVFIIGGQSFPLELFPGMVAASTFYDGQVEHYTPSLPEFLLGAGGIGVAFLITAVGVRVLHFLPEDDLAQLEAAGSITD